MSPLPDFDGPPMWEVERPGGRVIARERRYKGNLFLDLRLWAAEGTVATGKGFTIPCEAAGSLANALAGYVASRPDKAE